MANATRHRSAEKQQEIEAAAAMKIRVAEREKIQRTIDQFSASILEKSQEIERAFGRIDIVISSHRRDYDKIGKMRNTKRQINSGSPDDTYRISEIEYEIGSITNDMNMKHNDVINYMDTLDRFTADASSQKLRILSECQADALLNCARMSAGLETLRAGYEQFRNSYRQESLAFQGKRS